MVQNYEVRLLCFVFALKSEFAYLTARAQTDPEVSKKLPILAPVNEA